MRKSRERGIKDYFSPKDEVPKKVRKKEDEWREIDRNGLNLRIKEDYYGYEESAELLENLEKELVYLEGEMSMVQVFGKWHPVPRKFAAYGDPGVMYTFSYRTLPTKSWTPTLLRIKKDLEKASGFSYNFVLVNRYENGSQRMGEHRDNEKEILKEVPIASISLGQERDFVFRHADLVQKKTKESSSDFLRYSIALKSGTCLLMHYPTNEFWYHGLPQRKSSKGLRINLTFRQIQT